MTTYVIIEIKWCWGCGRGTERTLGRGIFSTWR